MQKRSTLLGIALAAVVALTGHETLFRPLVGQLGAYNAELTGFMFPGRSAPIPEGATMVAEYRPAPARREPLRGSIGRNSTLYDELRALGVSAVDIDILTRDTRKTYDWRKIRAGQEFDLYANTLGEVDSFLLYTSVADYVRVTRAADTYVASVEQVPYETTYHVTHGTIYNSVFASLDEQGAPTELASSFDDIFGWTIDLASDLRSGDEYMLLYESREYATGHAQLGNVLAARIVNAGKEFNAVRFQPEKGSPAYYTLEGQSMQKAMRRSPLKFANVTSGFSYRRLHPVQKVYKPHYGVDYAAPRGTPIHATGDGVVIAAHYAGGNGKYVKIRHNKTYETMYLHMSGFAKGISAGVRVSEGQCIGYVGATGMATAPHVCYRMYKNGAPVNPRKLDLPAREPVPPAQMAAFTVLRDAYLSRLHEALMEGVINRSIVVEQPVRQTPMLRASVL